MIILPLSWVNPLIWLDKEAPIVQFCSFRLDEPLFLGFFRPLRRFLPGPVTWAMPLAMSWRNASQRQRPQRDHVACTGNSGSNPTSMRQHPWYNIYKRQKLLWNSPFIVKIMIFLNNSSGFVSFMLDVHECIYECVYKHTYVYTNAVVFSLLPVMLETLQACRMPPRNDHVKMRFWRSLHLSDLKRHIIYCQTKARTALCVASCILLACLILQGKRHFSYGCWSFWSNKNWFSSIQREGDVNFFLGHLRNNPPPPSSSFSSSTFIFAPDPGIGEVLDDAMLPQLTRDLARCP